MSYLDPIVQQGADRGHLSFVHPQQDQQGQEG